jgi:type II secretory pathway pseudopilin PulG
MSAPQVDWTFGPAPSADEPPPPAPVARPPRPGPAAALRLSRRTWLLLGALVVLAVALTVALPALQNARDRQAVEQLVARQEQARLAGDWVELRATYAPDGLGWAASRLTRMQNGWLPTPLSLPGLRSDGQPGRVTRFQVVGQQLARADVTRGFVLADGTPVSFAMPQFYQYTKGTWWQVAPPAVPRDQAQHFHGARLDVTYYPDDADLAPALASQLDDLLQRACADWDCPPELRVAVVFDPSDPAASASRVPFDTLLGSLTLQTILGRPTDYPASAVSLASRVTGGYAADPAAAEAVRRAAGVRVLILLAQQLAPKVLEHGENAYLDGLIAREAARLGIDEAGLDRLQIANPVFQPDDLWSLPLLHASSAGALPEALVILNNLLANYDVTDDARLMHAFNSAADADTWLATGLGYYPADGFYSLLSGLAYQNHATGAAFPSLQPAGFTPDFALSCPAGPLLGTLGGQTAPLLAGQFPDSSIETWSPDGRRLALRVSGRLSVVDVAGLTGQFVPVTSVDNGLPAVWASNAVLVYPAAGLGPGTAVDPTGAVGLAYFVVAARPVVQVAQTDLMLLPSPDLKWDAVLAQPPGSDLALFVTPSIAASGKTVLQAANGYNPAWSADSRRLVYAVRGPSFSNLVLFDLQTQARRTIFTSDDPRAPKIDVETSLLPVWSPGGDRLALAMRDTGGGYTGWAATLAPDGTAFQLLPLARVDLAPATLVYSADGQFLALQMFNAAGTTGVALYSAEGALLRWLPSDQLAAWSPAGHTLALVGLDGVSLLSAPQAEPRRVGPRGCSGLAWRP